MSSTPFNGKGSKPRPSSISLKEKDLRWELMSSRTSPERKEEIKKILEEIKNESTNPS